MNVILASQSPRRKSLMELFHVPFTVRVADVDETMFYRAINKAEPSLIRTEADEPNCTGCTCVA